MKKHLNAQDKINTIRLELRHPQTKNSLWILVEGEDDVAIFSKLLNGKTVKGKLSLEEKYITLCLVELMHT